MDFLKRLRAPQAHATRARSVATTKWIQGLFKTSNTRSNIIRGHWSQPRDPTSTCLLSWSNIVASMSQNPCSLRGFVALILHYDGPTGSPSRPGRSLTWVMSERKRSAAHA